MYTLIILEYRVKQISIFLDVKYGILLSPNEDEEFESNFNNL